MEQRNVWNPNLATAMTQSGAVLRAPTGPPLLLQPTSLEQSDERIRGEPGGDSGFTKSSDSRRRTSGPSPCTDDNTGFQGTWRWAPFLERRKEGTGGQEDNCAPCPPGPPSAATTCAHCL